MERLKRRLFIVRAGAGAVAASFGVQRLMGQSKEATSSFSFGLCNSSLGSAAEYKSAGAEYLEVGARSFLMPDKPDSDFAKNLEKAKASVLPIQAANGFLPDTLLCVGPDANPEGVCKYADVAFRRAKQIGIRVIVLGSAKSRKIPDGFSREKAEAQFVDVLKRMGPLAEAQGVTVAIEPLNRKESNFINTVVEGAAIAEKANHPAIRLLADMYHVLRNEESPDDLRKVGPFLVHCHIAEKEGRTAPGVNGQDFRPFFAALRAAGYKGRVSIEGKWKPDQLPKAFATLREQSKA